MCRNTRAIITRVPRHYRLMTTDPPPDGAAYADEGDANLLLSFHVCLTRKHAMHMPQVHSRFRAMAAKHRDGRGKRPRHEVNACPSYHACIDHLYALQVSFHYASAWLPSPDRGLERVPRDQPTKVTHEPTRCYFVVSLSPMRHVTLCCTGIGLWEVMKITSHRFVTKAALEDPKGPSRSDLRWCIGLAVLCFLMPSAP